MEYSINAIIKDYKKHNPQGHWFDADTMSYWGTRFVGGTYVTPCDGSRVYFVTEEDNFAQDARLFSVRVYDFTTHEVDTLSWQQDTTAQQAHQRARFNAGAKVEASPA